MHFCHSIRSISQLPTFSQSSFLKPVCQFWRIILFEAISAFSAINVKVEVFSQKSKVLINSRPFKIPNSLEVYKPLYKKERLQGAFSFWKLMPLLLSRWCSQTLQKFHQRENYIKIILQTQTTLTPHLRILYFHLPTSYKRQLKVICALVQRMQFSQFSANFTILMRFHNVLAKLHSLSKFQEINVEYKRVKRQRDKETWGTNMSKPFTCLQLLFQGRF